MAYTYCLPLLLDDVRYNDIDLSLDSRICVFLKRGLGKPSPGCEVGPVLA